MTVPTRVLLFLVIGVLAASQSGNLIRLGDAHPVAIAAWRLLLASVLLAPLAGQSLRTLKTLDRKELGLLVLCGTALAFHFFTWIGAVQQTTVANASMAFASNPVLTAVGAYVFFGERPSRRLALAVALGIAGVAVIGWSDLRLEPRHFLGDALALLCSLLFTVYFLLGKRLRQKLPNTTYVTALYGVAAIVSFLALFALRLPVVRYSEQTWLCFVLMAIVPTMIGHTSMNNALAHIDAGKVAAVTLCEPLLAGVVAFFAWGETISAGSLAGFALIAGSIVVLGWDAMRGERRMT